MLDLSLTKEVIQALFCHERHAASTPSRTYSVLSQFLCLIKLLGANPIEFHWLSAVSELGLRRIALVCIRSRDALSGVLFMAKAKRDPLCVHVATGLCTWRVEIFDHRTGISDIRFSRQGLFQQWVIATFFVMYIVGRTAVWERPGGLIFLLLNQIKRRDDLHHAGRFLLGISICLSGERIANIG